MRFNTWNNIVPVEGSSGPNLKKTLFDLKKWQIYDIYADLLVSTKQKK